MKKSKRTAYAADWVSSANWLQLNEAVKEMTEQEAWDMLQHEGATYARKSYLDRLYYRFSLLRRQRERQILKDLSASAHRGH